MKKDKEFYKSVMKDIRKKRKKPVNDNTDSSCYMLWGSIIFIGIIIIGLVAQR